jgi:hypothetical protein
LRLLEELRDPKPRLKPGITFPRLIAFVVAALALAVFLIQSIEAPDPYRGSECERKGIDSYRHNVGTRDAGSSTIVVIDKAETLQLPTLEAKLLGFHETTSLHGPAGTIHLKGFFTVDLALTNRTDEPAKVARGQVVLYNGSVHLEDAGAEEGYEPRSFLARSRAIPPGGTEYGTVAFASSGTLEKQAREGANLDVVNLGSSVPTKEPEALFSESEYGVIRTYR